MNNTCFEQKCALALVVRPGKYTSFEHSKVLLDSFKNIASEMYIIADISLADEEKESLKKNFGNIVFLNGFSENSLNVYKQFLKKNIISDNINRIILLENEWFGAIYPMMDLFNEMKNEGTWCLLRECQNDFLVINTEKNTGDCSAISQLDRINEGTYIPTEAIECSELFCFSEQPSLDFPCYLLKKKRLPLIRKRLFTENNGDVIERNSGENAREVIDYISGNTEYDREVILKYLIKTCNMADIKKKLQLNCTLSSKIQYKRKNIIKKVAFFCHLYYQDQAEFVRNYMYSMPEGCDAFITVPDEKCKINAENVFDGVPYNVTIRVIGNRGRDVGALLTGLRDVVFDYDLVCTVHDKKVMQLKPYSIGESWAYKCFENLLKSRAYVENVISHFEENPSLGIATPPAPVHADYYPVIGYIEWGNNFDNVVKLAKRLNVRTIIEEKKEPVAPIGTMFWFRPDALKHLYAYEWKYEDYPKEPNNTDATLLHAIERFYQFAAQAAGYYTEWIMCDTYAQIEEDNLDAINHVLFTEELRLSEAKTFKTIAEDIWKRNGENAVQ